jgi:hypothetical protein
LLLLLVEIEDVFSLMAVQAIRFGRVCKDHSALQGPHYVPGNIDVHVAGPETIPMEKILGG